jgi:DNA-binding NarL/FixJ family response regulator
MSQLKILIVDDHTLFRDGLHLILAQRQDLSIVGDAADGLTAIEKARALSPDIVLLDIAMPKLNGIDTMKQIKSVCPKTKVIILTMHAKDQYIHEALNSGANGYVLKDSASSDLIAAITAVARGEAYLSPAVSKRMIDRYVKGSKGPMWNSRYESLSAREREILKIIGQGLSARQISEILCISIRTVENHRNNIMKKLDLHSTSELIKYAIQMGLVDVS